MAYYSKIADIRYEDPEVKITIPIRIKKIEVEEFGHPENQTPKNCPSGKGSINYIERYLRRTGMKLSGEYKIYEGNMYAKEVFDEQGNVICPVCRNPLPKTKKTLYKLYTSKIRRFVDVCAILGRATYFGWKNKIVQTNTYSGREITVYGDTLEKIYEALAESKENLTKTEKKTQKIKITINKKITDEILDKEISDYKGRKIIKEL